MKLIQLMDKLKASPEFAPNITNWHVSPRRDGKYAEFPAAMDERIKQVLRGIGISRLYSHQAQAFEMARSGRDFVVVTPTASGKSLCYNLPVMNTLMTSDPEARALYLFPTKALSADQVDELYSMVEASGRRRASHTGVQPAAGTA